MSEKTGNNDMMAWLGQVAQGGAVKAPSAAAQQPQAGGDSSMMSWLDNVAKGGTPSYTGETGKPDWRQSWEKQLSSYKGIQEQIRNWSGWDKWTSGLGVKLEHDIINAHIDDVRKYRSGLNDPYAQAAVDDYLKTLYGTRNAVSQYGKAYGNFGSAEEYSGYMDWQKGLSSYTERGKSHDDYFQDQKAAADIAQTAYQSAKNAYDYWEYYTQQLQQMEWENRKAEELGGPGSGPYSTEDMEAVRAKLGGYQSKEEAEAAAEKAAKDAQAAQIGLSFAKSSRYSDLAKREDWNLGVKQGEKTYQQTLKEVQQNRAQRAAEVRQGNVEVAGLSNEELAGKDYYSYRMPTAQWTDEERYIYYYLLDRNGGDPAEAYQYAIDTNYSIMASQRAKNMSATEEFGGKNAGTYLLATGARVLTAPMGIWDYLGDLAEYADTGLVMPRGELSPRDYANALSGGAARSLNAHGTLDEDIPIIGGKGWGDVYQLGNSIAESMAFAGAGKAMQALGAAEWIPAAVTNLSFFGSAASETTQEALQRGASSEQALVLGFLSGSAEALGETLSVENLIHLKDPASVKRVLLNVLVQGGIEGSEEGLTTLLNTASDAIVMKDKSELNTNIQTYLAQGMTADEAKKKAWKEWSESLAFDVLGGILSGGVSAGGQTALNYGRSSRTAYSGDQQALLTLAKEQGEESKAYKLAQQIEEKGAMSALDAARLEEMMPEAVEQMQKQQRDSEREEIRQEAERMLQEQDVEEQSARQMAVDIAQDVMGDELSREEKASHKSTFQNEAAMSVARELRLARQTRSADRFFTAQQELTNARGKKKSKGKSFQVSESTAKAQKDSSVTVQGTKSQIRDLVRDENGELQAKVQTDAGEIKTVSLEEIDFGESGLQELVQELKDQPDAPAMFAVYSSGTGIGSFINGWNVAKAYGRNSSRASAESILNDGMLEGVPDDVVRAAFNYGRRLQEQDRVKRQAEREAQAQKEKKDSTVNSADSSPEGGAKSEEKREKGGVSYDGGTVDGVKLKAVNRGRLNPRQRAQIQALELLGEKTGIQFTLFESDPGKNGRYQGANGMYKDGMIYIDVNAGRHGQSIGQVAMVRTAAHELTHYIQDFAPERYDELKQFLLDELIEWKGKSLGDLAAQKLQRDRSGKLTMEGALDEVVADGCEMMLRRTKVMQTMAQEKPTLFRTVKEWMQNWIQSIRDAFLGVSEEHEEARAVAKMELDRLERLTELWDRGLIEASQNAQKSPAREGGEVKYSFAGKRARSANLEALHRAEEMQQQGLDAERIRQETGWFRGMDNMWRFEIDDRGMQLFRGGDAQFAKDHPEYSEYKSLLNKVLMGTVSDEELSRAKELEETWGRELPRLSQRIQNGQARLENLIQHEALFEAYPELRNLHVHFGDLPAGERGRYVEESGLIVLSSTLKNETNGTLLHEIQHAIQHIEDFSSGASPDYWQDRIDFLDGRIEADQELLKSAEEEIGLRAFVSDSIGKVSKGERSMEEHWEAMQDFKENSARGEEIQRLEEDLKDLRAQRGKLIDANEAYYSTAGEIEARDTARRAGMTAEQRKNTRPDLDRRGVVFAEKHKSPDYMIQYTQKNRPVVVINDDILSGVPKNQWRKTALDALRKFNKGVPIAGKIIRINQHSRNEYLNSQNTRYYEKKDQKKFEDKLKAANNANEIILATTEYVNEEPHHARKDSIIDMARGKVLMRIGNNDYEADVLIGYTSGDVLILHDVEALTETQEIKNTGLRSSSRQQSDVKLDSDNPVRDNIAYTTKNSNTKFQERDALPDDRALLMQTKAEGRNAEALTAYQKKVKSLEALERKLQRQQDALEEARKKKGGDPELQKAAFDGWQKQIQKTEEQIRRAEQALDKMERSQELRQEMEKAMAAWREANPNEAAKAIRAMREEQQSLKKYVELLREEAKLSTPENRTMLPSDVRKMANALVKQYGSSAAVDSITEQLQELGDWMTQNMIGADTGYYVQLQNRARKIAREIVSESYELLDDNKEIREGIRDYLREHTLRISEDVRGDIPDFNAWRKAHMGTLRLGNEGMDINQAYQDLRSQYGEGLFPADVMARSDQLQQILDALDQVQPSYQQMFSELESWQAAEAIGNEIVDRFLSGEVRERETMADKAYQQRMKQLEEKYARKDKARQQALENAEDRAAYEARKRDEAEERRREERALRRQLVSEKVHELRERSIERDRIYKKRVAIEKKVTSLSKIMLENSGKRHVPDAWKETIGNFLASIDTLTSYSGEKSRAFHLERVENLQKMVQRQLAANRGNKLEGEEAMDYPQVFLDLNPMLVEMLEPYNALARESNTGTLTLTRMSLEKLQGLEEVLVALREAVDKQDALLAGTEKGETLSGAAGDTIEYMESLGKGKTGGMIRRFLKYDNLTPVYFFKRLGPGGEKIFRGLQRGWGKLAFNAQQIIDFSSEAYTSKEARAWEQEVHEFKLIKRESDLSGRTSLTKAAAEGGPEAVKAAEEANRETVKISTAQLMGLYCLLKREQARGHILKGGIRIWDITAKPTLKNRIAGENVQEQAERYLVNAEDIVKMTAALTDRQKEVADKLQKYMNTVGSSWGNQVSRARYGVDLFTEENYYPIQTDPQSRNARNPEADGTDLFHILNMGFTKNTVENARNGIVIHSIFDVFSNHMADMAKYNAMGLPMLDAMKWFNYLDETDGSFTSTRKAIETALGKNAERYFLGFMQDLNGSFEGGRRGEDIGSRMVSHAKVAAVGGNLRVIALQPTSYIRALAVLDPKYLLMGDNVFKIKQGIQEAQQYSGTAVWKSLGFYDMNINANMRDLIKHTDGALEKVREVSMIGAEWGDKTTWGRLWNATKAETRSKTGLSGEALLKATAERFDDVIYKTQVMDSTMTRSHLMRQKVLYAGMVTSFMSEPTLSYNLLLDAVSEWQDAKRSGKGLKTAAALAARAFTVYAISQISASIVESIFDALRDDDDYESLREKWRQSEFGLDGNLVQDLVLHNKLPYVRDVVSILQGFTNKRMDTEWVDYLKRAYTAVKNALEEDEDGNRKGFTWGTAYTVMRALSTITGLPVSNTARDGIALWNGIVVQVVPDWKLKTVKTGVTKPEASIKQAYQAGALSEEEAIRYLLRDAEIDSEDKARQKVYEWGLDKGQKKYDALLEAIRKGDGTAEDEWKKLRENGYSEDAIQSAVRSAVKEWYQDTKGKGSRMNKQAAIETLDQYGGMRRKDAEATVQEWTSYVSSPEKLQYEEIREAYIDGEITEERAVEMRTLYGGTSQKEAAAEVRKWSCEKETGIAYNELNEAFLDDEITQNEAVRYRMTYGGQSREEAKKEVDKWRCEKETGIRYDEIQDAYAEKQISSQQVRTMLTKYGGLDEDGAEGRLMQYDYIGINDELTGSSEAEALKYYTDLSGLGVEKTVWHEIWHAGNKMKPDYDENGKQVKDSRLQKVASYIDGFNLSTAAKDALFLQFYDEKNLRKTPWHK